MTQRSADDKEGAGGRGKEGKLEEERTPEGTEEKEGREAGGGSGGGKRAEEEEGRGEEEEKGGAREVEKGEETFREPKKIESPP